MRRWDKFTLAQESRRRWLEMYGDRDDLDNLKKAVLALGDGNFDPDKAYETTQGRVGREEIRCDECGVVDPKGEVVELGETIEVHEEANRVNVCLRCLIKAMELLDS